MLAAESGMAFMRYQLGRVSVPPNTPINNVIDRLYEDLQAQLEDTGNIADIARDGNTIVIPATGWVNLDAAGESRFRATITDWAGEIVVKVDGLSDIGELQRSISMDFSRRERTSSVFSYAMASRGRINMRRGSFTSVSGVSQNIATMMSALGTHPSISVSGGIVGGMLNIVAGGGAQVTGGTVNGSNIPSVILSTKVNTVDEPEFPTLDTTLYRAYATNTYTNARTQTNIRIPAGTNPQFTGNDTVRGILYIESPNTVTFRGNFNLHGFLVFENAGNSNVNVLDFRGNVSQQPLPSGSQFDALRATSGVSILAPTTRVVMSGSTDSTLRGNVIAERFHYAGSADIQVTQGSMLVYGSTADAVDLNGRTIRFASTGANNMPTVGVRYSSFFAPNPTSYLELMPGEDAPPPESD
jgi:hypothetical protein